MRMKLALLVLTTVLLPGLDAASAQAPPTPKTPPQQTAPPAPPQSADCAPSGKDGQTTGQAGRPLGDRLAESNGVLCPPTSIDPAIRAPAPDVGKMPVIPPPGSPGGDPSIRPK